MLEVLALWGVKTVGKATWSFSKPILEAVATDVAKDTAKSYVGKCFKSVFSVIHREPLTKATGLALKELLDSIEYELSEALDEATEAEKNAWQKDVARFVKQAEVTAAFEDLFLKPDYKLDPKDFAAAWAKLEDARELPEDFRWKSIARSFSKKVAEIRASTKELQETFDSLARAQDSEALQELVGLPPDFDLDTYREALVERYGNLDFASMDTTGAYYSGVKLWSVFVAQSARECHEYDPQLLELPKEELVRLVEAGELDAVQLAESEKYQEERRRAYINQLPEPILEAVRSAANSKLVVLGDPGSGKSSLLRYLALQWAKIPDANQRYTSPLPLLIELREYSRWKCPSGKSFPRYLHEASTWHRLNQQTLKHMLEQPDRVVLLLDGLDEVFDPQEREWVVNDIHRFSNEYKQVRIVLTSRVVGYQARRLRDAEFRHFMLQDLDEGQIRGFLDRWHEVTFEAGQVQEKRERLDRAIANSKSIGQLAGNPLLLTMMAILNRHQELPRERAKLYERCSEVLLHQWDTERALGEFPGLSAEIGLREKTEILRVVAYAMQTEGDGESRANYIDGARLEELIAGYLQTERQFGQAREAARALVRQLRERNFILCFLGADSYAFVHRTFLEYFCAMEIVEQFKNRFLRESDILSTFKKHCRDDDWREILRLICSQSESMLINQIILSLVNLVNIDLLDASSPPPKEIVCTFECWSEARKVNGLQNTVSSLVCCITKIFKNNHFPNLINQIVDFSRHLSSQWLGICWDPLLEKELHWLYDKEIGVEEIEDIRESAKGWPYFAAYVFQDRDVVINLAIHSNYFTRKHALYALAEKWPDSSSRKFLEGYAVTAINSTDRHSAILVLCETWYDEGVYQFLRRRTIEEEHWSPRCLALSKLSIMFPNNSTRYLVEQCALHDKKAEARSSAFLDMAQVWKDEGTRNFLLDHGLKDEDERPRCSALSSLFHIWPSSEIQQTVKRLVFEDSSESVRRRSFSLLGRVHSKFGSILTNDERARDRDPLEPVPRDHIEAAAQKAGIPPEEIDTQVASLSAHCGWDITIGAKPEQPDDPSPFDPDLLE